MQDLEKRGQMIGNNKGKCYPCHTICHKRWYFTEQYTSSEWSILVSGIWNFAHRSKYSNPL